MTSDEAVLRFWLRQQRANQARNRLSVGRARHIAARGERASRAQALPRQDRDRRSTRADAA
jgi:hypothetical protein